MAVVIVDIDKTIADPKGRVLAAMADTVFGSDTFWDAFNSCEYLEKDKPIEESYGVLRELARTYDIYYVTARPSTMHDCTQAWLDEYEFPEGELVTRPEGSPITGYKYNMFQRLDDTMGVDLVIDDEKRHIQSARKLGIPAKRIRSGRSWQNNHPKEFFSAADYPETLEPGTRVKRGPDWLWGDQDFDDGAPCEGSTFHHGAHGWVSVKWDSGHEFGYRYDPADGIYDVVPVEEQEDVEQYLELLGSEDYPETLEIGTRVKRGPTWRWGDQGDGTEGTVVQDRGGGGWFRVRWDNGSFYGYRYNPRIRRYDVVPVEEQYPETLEKGTRVKRGPDWKWGNQDFDDGAPCEGVVVHSTPFGWVSVKWDCGAEFGYRYDTAKGIYDVVPVEEEDVEQYLELLGSSLRSHTQNTTSSTRAPEIVENGFPRLDLELLGSPKNKIVIVDLDGTIADPSARESRALRITKGKRGGPFYGLFLSNAHVKLDTPFPTARKVLTELARRGIGIVYVTSRPKRMTVGTQDWLRDHSYPDGDLYLRPSGKSVVYKRRIFSDLADQYDVVAVIDDEDRFLEIAEDLKLPTIKIRRDEDWATAFPDLGVEPEYDDSEHTVAGIVADKTDLDEHFAYDLDDAEYKSSEHSLNIDEIRTVMCRGAPKYSRFASRLAYGKMMDIAKSMLGSGQSVILDATFVHAPARHYWYSWLDRNDYPLILVQLTVSDAQAKQRAVQRETDDTDWSEADYKIYEQLSRMTQDLEPEAVKYEAGYYRLNTDDADYEFQCMQIAEQMAETPTAVLLYGPPLSGKSTTARTIESFLVPQNQERYGAEDADIDAALARAYARLNTTTRGKKDAMIDAARQLQQYVRDEGEPEWFDEIDGIPSAAKSYLEINRDNSRAGRLETYVAKILGYTAAGRPPLRREYSRALDRSPEPIKHLDIASGTISPINSYNVLDAAALYWMTLAELADPAEDIDALLELLGADQEKSDLQFHKGDRVVIKNLDEYVESAPHLIRKYAEIRDAVNKGRHVVGVVANEFRVSSMVDWYVDGNFITSTGPIGYQYLYEEEEEDPEAYLELLGTQNSTPRLGLELLGAPLPDDVEYPAVTIGDRVMVNGDIPGTIVDIEPGRTIPRRNGRDDRTVKYTVESDDGVQHIAKYQTQFNGPSRDTNPLFYIDGATWISMALPGYSVGDRVSYRYGREATIQDIHSMVKYFGWAVSVQEIDGRTWTIRGNLDWIQGILTSLEEDVDSLLELLGADDQFEVGDTVVFKDLDAYLHKYPDLREELKEILEAIAEGKNVYGIITEIHHRGVPYVTIDWYADGEILPPPDWGCYQSSMQYLRAYEEEEDPEDFLELLGSSLRSHTQNTTSSTQATDVSENGSPRLGLELLGAPEPDFDFDAALDRALKKIGVTDEDYVKSAIDSVSLLQEYVRNHYDGLLSSTDGIPTLYNMKWIEIDGSNYQAKKLEMKLAYLFVASKRASALRDKYNHALKRRGGSSHFYIAFGSVSPTNAGSYFKATALYWTTLAELVDPEEDIDSLLELLGSDR
jgi:predicted kinase/phosphoglycolate phosphatase-like HAD superfamily hydrolase